MTDRIRRITVLLERDTRDDDAEPILDAIRMVKGVAEVTPHVVTSEDWVARRTAKTELRSKISKMLRELWED